MTCSESNENNEKSSLEFVASTENMTFMTG